MKFDQAGLGIIGCVIALIIGVASFLIGDFGQTLGIEGTMIRQILSIALPVFALPDGGTAIKNGVRGGILMLISAAGILFVPEISFFSIITSIPIGLGGILYIMSGFSNTKDT